MRNHPVVYLLILAFFWGSSFILMKIGLVSFTSQEVALLRLSLAGWIMLPFIRWKRLKIARSDWVYFIISGFVGSAIPAFLFTEAQTTLSSSLAGALNGLTPVFALLVGVLVFRSKLDRYKVLGVGLGLIGAFVLMYQQNANVETEGSLLVVLATLLYGTNVNVIKHKLHSYPALLVAALPLFMVSLVTTTVLLVSGVTVHLGDAQHVKSLAAIVVLAVVGTGLSLVLFNRLIQRTSAVFASSVTYLIPIVALFWGVMDDENIQLNHFIGLLFILLAIWLIRKSK